MSKLSLKRKIIGLAVVAAVLPVAVMMLLMVSFKTSVVYGMPAAAVELGGASEILPLDKIADAIAKNIANRKGSSS